MRLSSIIAPLISESAHEDREFTKRGWDIVLTNHGESRDYDRSNSGFASHSMKWDLFLNRVIDKIERIPKERRRSGEYMFTSRSANQSVVFNVDPTIPQLRVITILPPGKHWPQPGTTKVLIESYVIL